MSDSELGGRIDRLMAPIALGLAIAAGYFLWTVANGPPIDVPLSDFGRDLLGASASRVDVSPYQQVGELVSQLPEWSIDPAIHGDWIAHSPFSIGIARGLLATFGVAGSEVILGLASWFSAGFIVAWLGLHSAARWSRWHGLAISALVAMSFGLAFDIFYLHGASVTAAMLVVILGLDRTRRTLALVLLGLLVGWKPWLAPVAVFLPHRKSILFDVSVTASTAVLANLAALAWIGGSPVLRDWLGEALPANLAQVQPWALNLSIVGTFLSPNPAGMLFVMTVAVSLAMTRIVPRAQWPLLASLTIVIASPQVWAQYWFALTPLIVLGFRTVSYIRLLAVLLLISVGVGGLGPAIGQVCVAVAALLMSWEAAQATVDDYREANNPPDPGWRALKYRDLLKSRRMTTD